MSKKEIKPGDIGYFSKFGKVLKINKGTIIRETPKMYVLNTPSGETRRMKKGVFLTKAEAIIHDIKLLDSFLSFDYSTSCLEIYRAIAELLETNPEEFL